MAMATDEETRGVVPPVESATHPTVPPTTATTTVPETVTSTTSNTVRPTDEDLPDADSGQTKEQDEERGRNAVTEAPSEPQSALDQQASEQPSQHPPTQPGPRATRLQQLFDSSLQHTLGKVSWDNFAACYPTAASRAPGALKTVHKAMVTRLGELCAAEFALVLKNRQVVQKMNELEELSTAAGKRRQKEEVEALAEGRNVVAARAPHTLLPETVLAAHLAPQRREQAGLLRTRLQQVQAANAERFSLLARQKAEAEQLVSSLEQALADTQRAAALLDGDGLVGEVARETRMAEVQMSGV